VYKMTGFFASIFFIGILLIVVSFLLILIDKKKSYDYRNDALEKKEDLVEVIKDAEQMLLELNKFSDYIITQVEQKNMALNSSMKDAEEIIKGLKKVNNVECIKEEYNNMYDYGKTNTLKATASLKELEDRSGGEELPANKNKKDNVISINSKHRNVFSLSDSGMNDIEIARKLNIGRGEVQLIKKLAR